MSRPLTLELTTVENGRTWQLYSVEYDTADGTFGTYVYALSMDHARMIVEELKQTARLVGSVDSITPENPEEN